MVTDEELKEIVDVIFKDRTMTRSQLKKRHKNYTKRISELLVEARILDKKRAILRKEMSELRRSKMEIQQRIGDLKGWKCPAHLIAIENAFNQKVHRCELRRISWSNRFYEESSLFKEKCSKCNLPAKVIRKKLAFKRLFVKGENK